MCVGEAGVTDAAIAMCCTDERRETTCEEGGQDHGGARIASTRPREEAYSDVGSAWSGLNLSRARSTLSQRPLLPKLETFFAY